MTTTHHKCCCLAWLGFDDSFNDPSISPQKLFIWNDKLIVGSNHPLDKGRIIVSVLDDDTYEFTQYISPTNPSFIEDDDSFDNVSAFCLYNGSLAVGTTHGHIYLFDGSGFENLDGTWTAYHHAAVVYPPKAEYNSPPRSRIHSLHQCKDGRLFASSRNSLSDGDTRYLNGENWNRMENHIGGYLEDWVVFQNTDLACGVNNSIVDDYGMGSVLDPTGSPDDRYTGMSTYDGEFSIFGKWFYGTAHSEKFAILNNELYTCGYFWGVTKYNTATQEWVGLAEAQHTLDGTLFYTPHFNLMTTWDDKLVMGDSVYVPPAYIVPADESQDGGVAGFEWTRVDGPAGFETASFPYDIVNYKGKVVCCSQFSTAQLKGDRKRVVPNTQQLAYWPKLTSD